MQRVKRISTISEKGMLHDVSIEHTGLVVETQAMLSNDASGPRGIIGTIC